MTRPWISELRSNKLAAEDFLAYLNEIVEDAKDLLCYCDISEVLPLQTKIRLLDEIENYFLAETREEIAYDAWKSGQRG